MSIALYPRRHHSVALRGATAYRPILVALGAALVAAALPLRAQHVPGGGKGFRYSSPEFSLTLRGGLDRPRARSDIYDFTTETLTLSRDDFAALGLHFDLGLRVAPRAEIVLSAGMAGRERASEFRKFIDNESKPIEQRTLLRRSPLSIGVRYALMPTGEQVSKLAWVPARVTPWIGLGGGIIGYKFRQQGDFVNFKTLAVFNDKFSSYGFAPMGYGSLGADWSLSARSALVGDVRYTASRARLSSAFKGFDRIDLSGVAATMGISYRY